jgi:hypothetical protein
MARAIAALALRRNRSITSEIRKNVRLEEIEAAVVPLTPFRRRERSDIADVALGWITLWELLASCSSTGQQGSVTAPAVVVARARAYLASRELGQSGDLRKVMTDVLGPAGEATADGAYAEEPDAGDVDEG